MEDFPGKYIAVFHFQDYKINPRIPLGGIDKLGAGPATEDFPFSAFGVINYGTLDIGIERNGNLVSYRVGINRKGKWPAFPVYPEDGGV